MRRRVILGIVAIGLAYLYILALVNGIGLVAAQPVPAFWTGIFPTRHSGALSWILMSHLVVVLLASLPFAWIIVRVYGRSSVAVSLAIALLIWGTFEVPVALDALRSDGFFAKGLWFADTIQLVGSLPVLVVLFRRLPSYNRFGGIDTSVSPGGDR